MAIAPPSLVRGMALTIKWGLRADALAACRSAAPAEHHGAPASESSGSRRCGAAARNRQDVPRHRARRQQPLVRLNMEHHRMWDISCMLAERL